MPWRGWVWAAVMVAAMPMAAARAGAVDCWLLDGSRMGQAADRGLCDDAFARNSRPDEPPALGDTASLPEPPMPPALAPAPVPAPVVTPSRKPVPKAASVRARPSPGGPHAARGASIRPARAGGSSDFFTSFQRDFGALVDLLSGGSAAGSRHRTEGGSGLPSHTGR